MKKQLFTLITLTSLCAQAQITPVANLPKTGDKAKLNQALMGTDISPIDTGIDKTWSFTFSFTLPENKFEYYGAADVPQRYRDTVSNLEYVSLMDAGKPNKFDNGLTFYNLSNDTLYTLGDQSPFNGEIRLSVNPIFVFNQPYGSTFTVGTREYKYAGYGKLVVNTVEHDSVVMYQIVSTNDTSYGFYKFDPYFLNILSIGKISGSWIAMYYTYDNGGATTGLKQLSSTSVNLYPNPVNDRLYIDLAANTNDGTYEIFDLSGRIHLSNSLNNEKVDVSGLDEGIYFIKVSNHTHTVVRRFIKN